jgi:ribose-phosphate pyrophosphokinase
LANRRLIALNGTDHLGAGLADRAGLAAVEIVQRHFPDGESYFRVLGSVEGADVVVLAALDHPDQRALATLFALSTLRELGARSVGLVVPYLPYLRQDRRFHDGEAVSARLFCQLLDERADWVVTVDPHLHRVADLSEVIRVPSIAASAAIPMAAWVRENAPNAVLVGPDDESGQWVRPIAAACGTEVIILDKVRTGDRSVSISNASGSDLRGRNAVLVDDIISSGVTLARAAEVLLRAGVSEVSAMASHALFAEGAMSVMRDSGIERIATSDAVVHETNAFSIAPVLADAVSRCLEERS